jgi:nucleoprotein TPR
LELAQEELAQLKSKQDELQKTFDMDRAAWASDKTLEDTIIDLSTSKQNAETDRSSREDDIHQLEECTKVSIYHRADMPVTERYSQAAKERYSNEVVSHANSIKSIKKLKRQLTAAQSAARDNLNVAEAAKTKLMSSENSWMRQKVALDKEIVDLNARYEGFFTIQYVLLIQNRCKDVSEQNKLLHQHLESVSSQAARIRQAADSSATAQTEGDATADSDTKLVELRQVVQYLRKEKEIIDLQLELCKQESAQLKSQVDHLIHWMRQE